MMTNGDMIRSMNDEQLAQWLDVFDMELCDRCPKSAELYCEEELCHSQWLKWLKEENEKVQDKMTNKQWAIWQMIDMSEEQMSCFLKELTSCQNCPRVTEKNCHDRCEEARTEWLKQEHEE